MGWERFSYYLFSVRNNFCLILCLLPPRRGMVHNEPLWILGVLFGPISQRAQSCQPCMEPRIRYDSNGLASEHSMISRLSVAYQNVCETHVKS